MSAGLPHGLVARHAIDMGALRERTGYGGVVSREQGDAARTHYRSALRAAYGAHLGPEADVEVEVPRAADSDRPGWTFGCYIHGAVCIASQTGAGEVHVMAPSTVRESFAALALRVQAAHAAALRAFEAMGVRCYDAGATIGPVDGPPPGGATAPV